MVSFNRVVLAGNLTRDPELRFTSEGVPVCSFGLAVNRVRSKNEDVDFFDVSAWRELGETVANYKRKGDPILLEGRLQYRSWEAPGDGAKRSKVDVVADTVQFLPGKGGGDGGAPNGAGGSRAGSSSGGGTRAGARSSAARGRADDLEDDDFDDIPFAHAGRKRPVF
jgi:single-strand DNA-binding protein